MPTLADVAKVAGVGVMSVSRVVNGSRKVSPDTEAKVRAAIRRIGYEPNEAARVLKGHRARIIGLIVPDLADPFFATCANAIQEAAREAGFMTLMVASSNQANVERQQAEVMMQRQIAGLIVIPTGQENDYFRNARSTGLPIVSLDRPLENVDADSVLVDNKEASIRLVQHLIGHGHKEILCILDEYLMFTKQERLSGYLQAMREAKLQTRVCMVGPNSGSVTEQLPAILASDLKPTAIFTASDLLTVQVLRQLQSMNISIPQEIALAAFDDFDAASLITPQVTVIRQPVADLGRKAVSLLLQRIEGDHELPASHVVLETELIIRASCGCTDSANRQPSKAAKARKRSL
jgi:LacI family transcriptional regulator